MSDTYCATAYGIRTHNILPTGYVSNSGLLVVGAHGWGATAVGITTERNPLQGQISNSGTIGASANRGIGSATATGLFSRSIATTGTVTNSGSISAVASGAGDVLAYGQRLFHAYGRLIISGTIAATAEVIGGGRAEAAGIFTSESSNSAAELSNSGAINVAAQASGSPFAFTSAVGVATAVVDGSLANSGPINVMANSSGSAASAMGLSVNDERDGEVLQIPAPSAPQPRGNNWLSPMALKQRAFVLAQRWSTRGQSM